jgi:hypothetical protein
MVCGALRRRGYLPSVDVVEQSPVYVGCTRERARVQGCTVTVVGGRFEDYQPSRAYELVLAIHSLFGIDGSDVVDRLLSLRSTGGRLIVASNAQNSLLGQLKRIADIGYTEGRLEVDNVRSRLAELGVPYRVERFSTHWAVREEELEDTGTLLEEWLALGEFDQLPEDAQRRFRDVLGDLSHYSGGKFHWKEEEELVIV